MSIFSSIAAGLTKAENFLVTVFSRTAEVDATFAALAPATKAAVLATFYDAGKVFQSAVGAATAAGAGNIPTAVTLSADTIARLKVLFGDGKTDVAVFAADLKALGL